MSPGSFLLPLLAFLASPTVAQSTVVTLLDIGDYAPLRASVVAADSSATTYALACPPSDPSGCGYGSPGSVPTITAVDGPLTAVETVSAGPASFSTLACALTAGQTDSVTCKRVRKDGGAVSTNVDNIGSVSYVPVTVTAGLEKLAPGSGPTTPTGGSQSSSSGPPPPTKTPNAASIGRGSASMAVVCLVALLTGLALG